MQETITVTLTSEVRGALNDATRRESISPDELISRAIKQYLFLRQFRVLREKMAAQAEAQGISTDQDVFDRIT